MTDVIAAAHPGSTAGVRATNPTQACRAEKCEVRAHIGLFFDGTGNNQDWIENPSVNWRTGISNWWSNKPRNIRTQLQQRSDSNVARLFRSYRNDPLEGYFRMYVPGIGTPFKEIGEVEPEGLGMAFGAGGDGRINYGMLYVLNSMYAAISNNRLLVNTSAIQALCSTGQVGINSKTGQPNMSRSTQDALSSVGMDRSGGLLMDTSHHGNRLAFFKKQFEALASKIASTPKPQLVEVFIDVFGFSRGAAQARAFCNWMEPLFAGGRLAGVTTHIRFLGIFDSVASVGFGSSTTAVTDGHQSWGDAPYLRVPARVGQCEHYVAMHENRGAFPLEDLNRGGGMPGNCRQFRFPGMHSDVGGGYSPLDQGRGPNRSDADKLSQISLNLMFDAAVAAKVPLDKELASQDSDWDCYEVSATTRAAFDSFFDANGRDPRPLKECCMDYLAWRCASVDRYANLPATMRAGADDRADLIGANETLRVDLRNVDQADKLARGLADEMKLARPDAEKLQRLREQKFRADRNVASLSADALEIVRRARSYRVMTPAEVTLMSEYCHDSYAGFKPFDAPVKAGIDLPGTWESEGYLRYRTRYEGDDKRLTLRVMPATDHASQNA